MSKAKKELALTEIRRLLLKQLIDMEYGGSQTDLANAVGKSPQIINAYIKVGNGARNMGDKFAQDIETAINKPFGWLSDPVNINESYLNLLETQEQFGIDFEKIEQAFALRKEPNGLPLLTVRQVKNYLNGETDGVNEFVCSSLAHSELAFALLMPDDSLYAPTASISFAKDDVLIVEPSIEPESGDFVVVHFQQQNKTILAKILDELDGNRYLQNAAQSKQIMPDTAEIIGIVIEKQSRLFAHGVLEQRLNSRKK